MHIFYINVFKVHDPNLKFLVFLQDGQDLPPPIGFDVETPTAIPPCKVSSLMVFV